MSNINIFEHNSSRLLFYETSLERNLLIKDITKTTSDAEYCTEEDDYQYMNNWLLGKFNNKIYFLEDVGIYDSNHTHTSQIYYLDNNSNENVVWTVKREMEYAEECDRLYCEHSGSTKIILLDNPSEDLTVNFYIKYEKNLPSIYESIGTLINNETGEEINNCIAFYKYNGQDNIIMTDAIHLDFNLSVVNSDDSLMDNIYYCDINPKSVNIDFSRISIKYNISENTSNDIKLGMIGINTISKILPEYNYYGKFVGKKYYQNNDNLLEPMYFIVQAPKNRSWICYRTSYENETPGPHSIRKIENCTCYYIRVKDSGLNGYYGIFNNISNKYIYSITIDRMKLPFILMIPKIFWNYDSIKYYDTNNKIMENYDGTVEDIFNELDGMYYRMFKITSSSSINKIIIEYTSI